MDQHRRRRRSALGLRAVAVRHIQCLDTIYKKLTITQTARARPFPSFDHRVATGMHACYMPRDEGGCLDVSVHRSRRRRRIGGESRDLFINRKKAMSLTETAAMLRHRLHFAHRGQRVDAPQLIRGIPITVRTTREHLPFSLVPLTSPHRTNIPFPARQHFGSLARRLGRIFAHAYFHHREVFEQAEAESSLYARFLALSYKYDLVPPEFLVIGRPEFEASRLAALHREEFTLVISVG